MFGRVTDDVSECNMESRIAILPARGGSKRIPDKNIRDFCGKPMISYALSAASESGLFAEIHVSTESARIADVAAELGFPPAFARDPDLADDHTPVLPVARWVLGQYRARATSFDELCLLMPCAPLVEAADLRAAARLFAAAGGRRPVLAVAPYPAPVEWAFRLAGDGALVPDQADKLTLRSQDIEPAYYDAGLFSFFSASAVLGDSGDVGRDFLAHEMPAYKAVDIDEEEDWRLAEILYRGLHASRGRAMGAVDE